MNFQVQELHFAGTVHPDLESWSKKRLAVGNQGDEIPNFSPGHNNSLWEEVLYPETNYSTFCYIVRTSKLQLSQTCLMLNFVM